MKILIKNIKSLVQVRAEAPVFVKGADMSNLPCLEDAWLAIDDGKIADYGCMEDFPGISDWRGLEIIDATGKLVLPSWADSHTHIVYAASREGEFVDRIKGLSYEAIAAKGGGILNSAKSMRDSGEDELTETALLRLREIMLQGTGAVEIKSGYGLSTAAELKMLRVIKKLKEQSPLCIKATFLGAHAVPPEYKANKEAYIDILQKEMLPQIAAEGLADFIDVFCEQNYFTPEETVRILNTGKQYGLIPKVHAEQLSNYGGVKAGVACGAISVDHLEYVGDEEINVLKNSCTMPTLLPHPPARKMIDSGLPLAIASDYNPGSSPSGNMNLMQAICCVQYKMTPNETINACTLNSAYAMKLEQELGSITIGKRANVFITKAIPGTDFIPYAFGSNLIETVILNGKIMNTTSISA